jgi:hypothetical protein
VATEIVATQPSEQLIKDFLAHAPGASWSKRQPIAVALGIAGLFERAAELLQRAQLVGRIAIKELAKLVGIDVVKLGRRSNVADLL